MDKSAILTQIQREYALGLNYVRPARIRYRDRIMNGILNQRIEEKLLI